MPRRNAYSIWLQASVIMETFCYCYDNKLLSINSVIVRPINTLVRGQLKWSLQLCHYEFVTLTSKKQEATIQLILIQSIGLKWKIVRRFGSFLQSRITGETRPPSLADYPVWKIISPQKQTGSELCLNRVRMLFISQYEMVRNHDSFYKFITSVNFNKQKQKYSKAVIFRPKYKPICSI